MQLPVSTRQPCEPDMSVPLQEVSSVGPGNEWARSHYATCLHCRRQFAPDNPYPAMCNSRPRTTP